MKTKLLFIISIILMACCFAAATNVSPEEVKELIDRLKTMGVEVQASGFVAWLESSWFLLLGTVGYAGCLIVRLTPSKRDDIWWNKHIMQRLAFIGKIMSLGAAKKK